MKYEAININTADADMLSEVPAVGKEHAEDIIHYREEHGWFQNWNELKAVPGLTDSIIADMQKTGVKIESLSL
ncbi:MAG TPA: helix-hairpin-helix domain-containing protein [Syntrophales bacterium]|nr:helix-hairpin-helix domain-containing protein [Syntrophales bacterium]